MVGVANQFQLAKFDFSSLLVTELDDTELCKLSNKKEVRQVVFFIDPDSAPRPNGFCNRFYQIY